MGGGVPGRGGGGWEGSTRWYAAESLKASVKFVHLNFF